MLHLEFLVEEPSAVVTLDRLVPLLIQGRARHAIRDFSSKAGLLRALPQRLTAYRKQIDSGFKQIIIVLLDEDRHIGGCMLLKDQLEEAARTSGLITKTTSTTGFFHVVNRLAVEELEAWFLGDIEAIRKEHPRLPESLARRKGFRDPDAVKGGTWESLYRVLRSHGYYPGIFPKIEFARKVAPHLVPERNRSRSFRTFCNGVRAALA